MKKVIEVSIGGINFTMEDDAYFRLKEYLKRFEETILDKAEAKEVMEDVEARVAEIFQKEMKYSNQVVDDKLVQIVIDQLGEVESKAGNTNSNSRTNHNNYDEEYTKGEKRFFRNMDEKMIAGVCSGLASYTGLDVTIIRIIFVIVFFVYGTGLMAYMIVWFAAPKAMSVAQKLQMKGYAPTAENIRKYTSQHK